METIIRTAIDALLHGKGPIWRDNTRNGVHSYRGGGESGKKAGKFYVPLDPSYPLARLRYMVQDAQTGLLLTSDKDLTLASQLVQPGCQLLNLEALPSSIGNANPGLAIAPEALAYIIYTSSSQASDPRGCQPLTPAA
jgi:hypothetical protein